MNANCKRELKQFAAEIRITLLEELKDIPMQNGRVAHGGKKMSVSSRLILLLR